MKKLYLLFTILVLANSFSITKAQDFVMPSDEAIKAAIEQFGIEDSSQKEFLFNETKKKLQEGISSGEFQKMLNQESNLNNLKNNLKNSF